jgi:hypothetical protein
VHAVLHLIPMRVPKDKEHPHSGYFPVPEYCRQKALIKSTGFSAYYPPLPAYRRLPLPLELLLPPDRELPEELDPERPDDELDPERPDDELDEDGRRTVVEVELLFGLLVRVLPDVERVTLRGGDFPEDERLTRRDDPVVPFCVPPDSRLEVAVMPVGWPVSLEFE